jgi:hypothetical protein
MATADALMLTGVLRYCSDCDGERIFVEPDEDSFDILQDAARAAFACTDCGAALFIDPTIFAFSGVTAAAHAHARETPDQAV